MILGGGCLASRLEKAPGRKQAAGDLPTSHGVWAGPKPDFHNKNIMVSHRNCSCGANITVSLHHLVYAHFFLGYV